MSLENPGEHHNAERLLPIMERDYQARIAALEAALRWTWDNSKLLESAIPVPSSILKTYRSLQHSQSDAGVKS